MHTHPTTRLALLITLLVTLPLALAPAAAEEEIEAGGLGALTEIGPDARETMSELLKSQETAIVNTLRAFVVQVDPGLGLEDWEAQIEEIRLEEEAMLGVALDEYRSWAVAKGAKGSEIKQLPPDWTALENKYGDFFFTCQVEGSEAYLRLYELISQNAIVRDCVFPDSLRSEEVEIRIEMIDDSVHRGIADLAAVMAKDTARTRGQLEKSKKELEGVLKGLANRAQVYDDIIKRSGAYLTGAYVPSTLALLVNDRFDQFIKTVRSRTGGSPRLTKEAELWKEMAQKHLETYDKSVARWLKTIDPLLKRQKYQGEDLRRAAPARVAVIAGAFVKKLEDALR